MDVTELIAGCGLNRERTAALPRVWENHVEKELGDALSAVYRFCHSYDGLTGFLWEQDEATWVTNQKTRWDSVFKSGIGPAHVEQVREFARSDLESAMNPAVYGQFFACMGRELATRVLATGKGSPDSHEAAILIGTLMNAEATIASSAYSEAQTEKNQSTIEELTGMMGQNVGDIIGGVAGASDKLSSSMATISQNVGRNLDLATGISGTVDSAVSKLSELSSAIDGILKLLDGIKSIAGQTNMLALNATIEAARAGEAGLGFAVVAREVKMLATDSREAADGIAEMTNRLSDTLGMVQSGFAEITERVSTMVRSIEENGAAADEQHRATGEIADRMARLGQEIDESISGIRRHYG
ncbi:methyl-accepting chemotaxis protein [Nisaea sp.]|uniref:methyl-accepting chemotaxis protein n=1 Tax=Nisaea sp. TaxID=2024842 RepID=UPI002B27087C|nr:methyl-accepting chemotaxis protein [Nisaea sp.]